MSIQVACTGCGKSYRVDDRFAGKRAKCKACGSEMSVPAASAAAPAAARTASAKAKVTAGAAPSAKPVARKAAPVEKSEGDFDLSALDAIEQGGEVDDNYVAPLAVAATPSDTGSSRRKGTSYTPSGAPGIATTAAPGSPSSSSASMPIRIAICVALAAALGVTFMLIRGMFHGATSANAVAPGDDLDKDPSLSLGEKMAIRHQRKRAADLEAASWREVEPVTLPQRKEFPPLPDKDASGGEVDQYTIQLNGAFQGEPVSMEIYVPAGEHAAKSMACALSTPLSTGLLEGYTRNDERDWIYKEMARQTGLVVVCFDLSKWSLNTRPQNVEEGPLELMQTDCAYHQARSVIEFVSARLPMVDPDRLYVCAPHEGGRMALYWASIEPRIKAVATWDPVCDVMASGGEWAKGLHIRKLDEFMKKTSPINFVEKIKCPVLVMTEPRPAAATKPVAVAKAKPKSAADDEDDSGDDLSPDSLGAMLGGRDAAGIAKFKEAMQKAGNPLVEQELKKADPKKQAESALVQMGLWLKALPGAGK